MSKSITLAHGLAKAGGERMFENGAQHKLLFTVFRRFFKHENRLILTCETFRNIK